MKIAVIGGGITGLSAALALHRNGVETTLFESGDRVGGKIATSPILGREIDEGPDAFLARVPWAVELCRSLGLGDRLISPAGLGSYVFSRGKLRRIPDGLVLGVPAGVVGLARGGVMGPTGVVRAGLEPLMARRPYRGHPDNVGAIIRHRFGDQVLERIVDPLLGGIYAGSADTMSLRAGAPQLDGIAANRSMLLTLRRRPAPPTTGPIFFSLPGGLAELVNAITVALGDMPVRLNTMVQRLERSGGQVLVHHGDMTERVDRVILATPAPVSARLLASLSADVTDALDTIAYASVAMVTAAVPSEAIGRPLDATGFLVPRPERRFVTACSWGSAKWPHWADGQTEILRVSAGASDAPGACDLDDADLGGRIFDDLERLMGLRVDPVAVRITRWVNSFPQYEPGHLERIAMIEGLVRRDVPEVVLAGAAYRGIGIPACIRQGFEAAEAAAAS